MQRLLHLLLQFLGPRLGISARIAHYFVRSSRLGQSDAIPSTLIAIGARSWSRGWLNRKFFDIHRDWILPYWAVHQLEPTDPAYMSRALSPVVVNLTHRDWTMVGNPASPREAIVDPRGLVTPLDDGWSLDSWVEVNGKLFAPSRLPDDQVEQKLSENLPIVLTQYDAAGLRVNQEVFAVADEQGDDWVIAAVTVENPRGEPRTATVYLSARPLNPEGVALMDRVEFRAGGEEMWINDALGAFIPKPDALACSNEEHGDVAFQIPQLNGTTQIESRAGIASALARYHLDLRPHSSRAITAVMPMQVGPANETQAKNWTASDQLVNLRRQTTARWRQLMKQGMTIRAPDDKLEDAFESCKAYLLLLHDGNSITPGPGLYHHFWLRDAAYLLNALDQLGYHDQVNQVLKTYPQRLQKNGYYFSQEREWDSNGEALWILSQHARLSGDLETLAAQYWGMLNGAHWIDATRQKTKSRRQRTLHHGLLPPGPSAEHLGPDDYFYWDDFWGLAGLRATADAAHLFAKNDDEKKLRAAFDAFREDLDASLAAAAQRTLALWMPASPYRRADSAMIANLVALYPLRLVAPDDPRLLATLDEIKRVAWLENAFFHHVGHAGFGTYLSLHVAGCFLYQRRAEAWPVIEWVLKHASPTYTWAEALHPLTRSGGHGDSPHGWAAAEFVSIVRAALLFEEDDHLVLTPALPIDWTYETTTLSVENAATYFGRVGFTIAFGDRTATLVLKGEWREPPAYVEWNLPFDLKTAGGEVAGVELMRNRVRIPSHVRKVVAMW